MTKTMQVGDYVKKICSKATELSIPREWAASDLRQQLTRGTPTPTIGGHRVIERCAVAGGGVMGRGIVISLLKAGYRTTLIERDEQTLSQRVADIWQKMSDDLQKGRVTKGAIANAGQLLQASTDFESLRNVDFVIEAVFENMSLKLDVFRTLDRVCPPHAILCSNTSTLDIEALARATKRPENVVGMHFFVPPHVIPGLEVIYSDATSHEAIGTVVAMGRKIEKYPIIMRNTPGFVGNRMFRFYLTESLNLVEAGYSPNEIDVAFRNFGFAMGPCQSFDLIGIDTMQRVSDESKWELSKILELLLKNGRLGRKSGKGFYLYKGGHRQHDAEVEQLISSVRIPLKRRPPLTQEDIVRRCLYPLVNEGFNILNERIVERPETVDAVWILGFGWPVSKGGPMYWAQTEGLKNVLGFLKGQKRENPDYLYNPSSLLERLVRNGAGDLPVDQWSHIIAKL